MSVPSFTVDEDLQAFVAGFGSRATRNVVIAHSFATSDGSSFPTSPDGTRLALIYSAAVLNNLATPSDEYQVFLSHLDGSSAEQITEPR